MKTTWLSLLVALGIQTAAPAIQIPVQIKKAVVFIYAPLSATNDAPDGTGFLVVVPDPKVTNSFCCYLVTAKHVLRPPDSPWLPQILVRINRRDGNADKLPIDLHPDGKYKNVFVHRDDTVDLAVIPFVPTPHETYDFLPLGQPMLTTKETFKALQIQEGSEVFFVGMFIHHLGTKRNTPIFRFGKVCLITDERISFVGHERELYLIEASAYGGNSGSPVFFRTGYEHPPHISGIAFGPEPAAALAGVVSGCFNDEVLVRTIPTGSANATFPSLGISAVTPAYKLGEILFSDELKAIRGH